MNLRRNVYFAAIVVASGSSAVVTACGDDGDTGGAIDGGGADVTLSSDSSSQADANGGKDTGTSDTSIGTDSGPGDAGPTGDADATTTTDASDDGSADGGVDANCVQNTPLVIGDGGFVGPSPYLQRTDSPFNCLPFTNYFHLEDFENDAGALLAPGVTASAGQSAGQNNPLTDSVDGDDGTITDGGVTGACSLPCRSWFTGAGSSGFEFTFDEGVLGGLPTHAGLVWTDGAGNVTVTFRAFGADGGTILDTQTPGIGDNSNFSTSGEDRFFGVVNDAGVKKIKIFHTAGGIEIDHLQYGR